MCLPLEFAAEVRPAEGVRPLRYKTSEEIHAEFLAWNAAQPDPWPICPECDVPFDFYESHPLCPTICDRCGTNKVDDLVMGLATARGRKARKRAVRRLCGLARRHHA